MNTIRTATLVAIFIKCVTASTDIMSPFREAVDKGDMVTTLKLYRSIVGCQKKTINYVIDKKDQGFIFKFAKQARVAKWRLLVALHRKKSPKIIEEAFKVFEFDQNDLKLAASEPELMCSPSDLFHILGKMDNQKNREEVIRDGVSRNLFLSKRTECIDPLLDALESNESFKHLKDFTVKKVFERGSVTGNKAIVECFHDHPTITSENYADGLFDSVWNSSPNPVLNFLLGEADKGDLNAVKAHKSYGARSKVFKDAIEKAFLAAKPSGDRLIRRDIQRAELVMKTFDENRSMGVPTEISELIASYLVEKSVPEPRIRFTRLVVKILESDDSGIRMATVVSQLILSYFSEESILESIATSFKQTISIKRKKRDDFDNESA